MSNLILMVIFVSAYVETSLQEGSKPPVCLVWTLSAVTNLVCCYNQSGTVWEAHEQGHGCSPPQCQSRIQGCACWCRCGMVGEEGNVQSRKTRSEVNSSSNIYMRVKKATWVYCHLIGRMCVACVHPLISDAVAPCWYQ